MLTQNEDGCAENTDDEERSGELALGTHLQPASHWVGESWFATLAGSIVLLGTLRQGIEGPPPTLPDIAEGPPCAVTHGGPPLIL